MFAHDIEARVAENPEWGLRVDTDRHGQVRFYSVHTVKPSVWLTPRRASEWLDVYEQGFVAALNQPAERRLA